MRSEDYIDLYKERQHIAELNGDDSIAEECEGAIEDLLYEIYEAPYTEPYKHEE
jgi:hypothetical protein